MALSLLRLVFCIPLLVPLFICLLISFFNPSFVDGLPVSLILITLFLSIFLFIFIFTFYRLLPADHSFHQSMGKMIVRLGQRRIVFGIAVFSFALYAILFGVSSYLSQANQDIDSPSLIIIGLDGATWDIIDPLMAEGKLPNLQKLSNNGIRSPLESIEPMRSPSLWTSICTGVSVESHGITGFLSTKADLKSQRIWEICAEHGLRVGLYSWLLSWPPAYYCDFVIPSWMAKTPETYPSRYACLQEIYLEQDRAGGEVQILRSLFQCACNGARLRSIEQMFRFYWKDWFGLTEEERLAQKAFADVRIRTDMFLDLLRRYSPDVTTFTLYGTDKLGHRFWHYMSPEAFPDFENLPNRFANVIPDYYQKADQALGRILDSLPPSTHILVLSDHGMKADSALPRQFFLNIPELLQAMKIKNRIYHSTVSRRFIFDCSNMRPKDVLQLATTLQTIHFASSKEPVFQVETDDNQHIQLRTNFSLSWHPDSPILKKQKIILDGKTYPTSRFFFSRTFSGCHDLQGILILSGPAFQKEGRLTNPTLLDIAPTVLYLLGFPISQEMEGKILTEAFNPSYLEDHSPKYVKKYEPFEPGRFELPIDDEKLKERLQRLGYI